VLAQRDGVSCFIEDMVVLSRDRRPATSTLRRTGLVATGGLGQLKQWATAHQVANAADAGVEAPTPLRRGMLGCPWGDEAQPLFAFDSEPACGRIADRPSPVVILGRIVAWSQASRSDRRLPVACWPSPGGSWAGDWRLPGVSSQRGSDAGILSIGRQIRSKKVFEGISF
jgi:hypothetical protein